MDQRHSPIDGQRQLALQNLVDPIGRNVQSGRELCCRFLEFLKFVRQELYQRGVGARATIVIPRNGRTLRRPCAHDQPCSERLQCGVLFQGLGPVGGIQHTAHNGFGHTDSDGHLAVADLRHAHGSIEREFGRDIERKKIITTPRLERDGDGIPSLKLMLLESAEAR